MLEFEKPILELESKIKELKKFSEEQNVDLSSEINKLTKRLNSIRTGIYGNLTAWQKVQIARYPHRPYTLDYIELITKDFVELHGDRFFGDDKAIIAGFAKLDKKRICIIGHQKGRDTKESIKRNFGCAHPEGYRKALRVMQLAEQAKLPIIIFIDTPGAYPGIGAEERGQAFAIATNLREMMGIKVPICAYIIGEGGSGGALGIGIADRIGIFEHSYYSVISPEGCAAILWKDSTKASLAAETLKLTGVHLKEFGIIDTIIPEPLGGAHRDKEQMANNLKNTIVSDIQDLSVYSIKKLLEMRYQKFRKIGVFTEKINKEISDSPKNN